LNHYEEFWSKKEQISFIIVEEINGDVGGKIEQHSIGNNS